jgi:hypothetical protein
MSTSSSTRPLFRLRATWLFAVAVAAAFVLGGLVRAQTRRELRWEFLGSQIPLERTKVPGGWLVVIEQPTSRPGAPPIYTAISFYPDPDHAWDGGSLPE